MKRFLFLLSLCTVMNFSGFGQMLTEPQPFPLNDYKISFYETQLNAETVEITQMDGSEIVGEQPKIILNEANHSIIIDFTDCSEGQYLISAKRAELNLEYSVIR